MAGIAQFGMGALVALASFAASMETGHAADSKYTKLILNTCAYHKPVEDHSTDGGRWVCRGYGGMQVHVAEGDLRFFVSYGTYGRKEIAANQTLPAFNTINKTLEWRGEHSGGQWRPYATILRWFSDSGDGRKSQILVVTRLGAGETCHVGYVNASRNRNANVMARQIADNQARTFRCGVDEAQYYGRQ